MNLSGEEEQLLELSNHDFAQGIARLIEYVMDNKKERTSIPMFANAMLGSSGGDAVSDRLSSFTYE